jgi:hypothetical protein
MAWEHWVPGPDGKLVQVLDEAFKQEHQPIPQEPRQQTANDDIRSMRTIYGKPPAPAYDWRNEWEFVPTGERDELNRMNQKLQRRRR